MAFELSYDGIGLPLITGDVESELDLSSVTESMDTLRNGWPASALAQRSWGAQPRQRPARIGTLFDPAGAGRHAVGHFLATRTIVNDIADLLNTVSIGSGGSGSAFGGGNFRTLKMETAQGSVERSMRLLPPKPIAGLNDPQLFLLTFVDHRYDAMHDHGPVNGPYQDWETWLAELNGVKSVYAGEAVDDRVKDRGRLRPAKSMWEGYRWPACVDAAAFALGVRFNGRHFVDPQWASNRIGSNIANFKRFSGGRYPWADTTGAIDPGNAWLLGVLPRSLIIDWPYRGNSAKWYSSETSMSGYGPPWRLTAAGIVCPTSGSSSGSGSGSGSGGEGIESAGEVRAFTDQLAESMAAWVKLGFCDMKTPGIVEWQPDGVHDVEYVYRSDASYTRIYRAPWHDGLELVQVSACPEVGAGSSGKIRVPFVTGICAKFLPDVGSGGSGNGQCPPGQHYDPSQRMCVDDEPQG